MRCFDMLVKLYELPEQHVQDSLVESAGIRIYRPLAGDKSKIYEFICKEFSDMWANEFEKAMSNNPISCFIAVNDKKEIIGFSCYDASCNNFFGPIGVLEAYRGVHVGRELLLHALYAMRDNGYAYGIIGWCEEKNALFYSRSVGAVEIPDSFPGIYGNLIL